MASRPGAVGKGTRSNVNIPQEMVTPTRREQRPPAHNSVDWLPVSEQNTPPTHNQSRKFTNIQVDSEYSDIDAVNQERGSRFVPVRPQPRSLVLRQRDNMGDHPEDTYNNFVGGNSPHASHAAIMIVNPTTPNSNQSINSSSSMNRSHNRSGSIGRDIPLYSSNTAPVCPNPTNTGNNNVLGNKPINILNGDLNVDNTAVQNGNGFDPPANCQNELVLPRTEAVRATGDSIVAACPDASRVEQRLGQIREYIRVTTSLVDSMRNSEDELKKRLNSLKKCNALLAAQAKLADGEDIGEVDIEEDDPEDEQEDSDLKDLLDTLQNLKDSEKKLEDMLEYLNDTVKDASSKIKDVCNSEVEPTEDGNDSGETVSCTTNSEHASVSQVKDEDLIQASLLNAEQESAARPTSAQSSFSAYSDNDLYQNEIKTNIDLTQMRLAAALQEQRKLLKYQAEAKEQLAEMRLSRNMETGANLSHNDLSGTQDISSSGNMYTTPPNIHYPLSSAKVYGINQIGVATTLPHISENNFNWNNQGAIAKRSSTSSDMRPEMFDIRQKVASLPSAQPDQTEIDMLRDLQMRRHHLENQVSKIQKLQSASSASADTACGPSGVENLSTDPRQWGGSEASEEERTGLASSDNSIRSKVATVNIMKAELERLKSMLRTVDSIQSNFGMNSTADDDNIYENNNPSQEAVRNRHRTSESSTINRIPLSRRDSASSTNNAKDILESNQSSKNQNVPLSLLSRLQNCISSSNKCTNVSEPHHTTPGELMGSELLAIQQLTDELRQAAQGITDERHRLKCVTNRDVCTSSGSSIKSEDKKQTNSTGNLSSTQRSDYAPNCGPAERKQWALKAELEAKKKQLERLMSKDVDHRTNQQSSLIDEVPSRKDMLPGESSNSGVKIEPSCSYQNVPLPGDGRDEYSSSEQEDDEVYLSSSRNQSNVDQSNEGTLQKSRCSSPNNSKDEPCYFGDSTRSLDGSFISQSIKHNQLQKANRQSGKTQKKGVMPMCSSLDALADSFQNKARDENRSAPEVCISGRTVNRENLRAAGPPLADCFLGIPTSNSLGTKDICNVSNVSNASSSSSGGERDTVPPPMPTLPTRHRHSNKSNRDNVNADGSPPQWQNPQVESQVTTWWHNKANQLQQQLELTTNLCQTLLQDKRASQASPSTLNSSQATINQPGNVIIPNVPSSIPSVLPNVSAFQQYQSTPVLNTGNMGSHPYYPMAAGLPQFGHYSMDMSGMPPMWSYQQQQQLATQQQQVAAAIWGSAQCIQHLLSQQREISVLRSTMSNLEERMQTMNMNVPRAHSTPPNINYMDNFTHAQATRTNSAQSNLYQTPQHIWPSSQFNNDIPPSYVPQNGHMQSSHFTHNRTSKTLHNNPSVAASDNCNNMLPANFSSNVFQQDSLSDQIINGPNSHSNISVLNHQMFNNSVPQPPMNPNVFSNHSVPHSLQNNRNPNSLVNLTSHGVPVSNANPMGQPLTGQSMALNNQVPPGNRANNYWDNFRSYSRQNLLSGSTKANAVASLSHSPHPLVERSHNTLHTGTPSGGASAITNTQVTNTPKRDVNLQGNLGIQTDNDSMQRRGRRNLSQDAYFAAPPDVLNVNQNVDIEQNQQSVNLLTNAEVSVDNRLHDIHNININRSINPIPEIIQAHSNNLNTTRSYGAYKKKSSSKLPAKNVCNTESNSASSSDNRNVEVHSENAVFNNPNLASASSEGSQEKSTTKLFDLLRENVYSEVTALISANESRPHFLIQLFRDLQQISSDTLRQRTLQSIQEVVSHYMSNVDTEYDISTSNNQLHTTNPSESVHVHIDNEIVKFILVHHADICTTELLEALCQIIVSSLGSVHNHSYLNQRLSESFANYRGCKVMDVSDDLIMTISSILISTDNKSDHRTESGTEHSTTVQNSASHPDPKPAYDPGSNERSCVREIHDEAVGPLFMNSVDSQELQDEASGTIHNPRVTQDDNPFVALSEPKVDLIESVENYNGDLAEADQSRHGSETAVTSTDGTLEAFLPDVVDTEEQTPTEAEAEWLGLDRIPTRLQMEDNPGNQSDGGQQ